MEHEMIRTAREYLNIAFVLSFITIVYNIAEGAISTYFGYEDETLALFGFGTDSFIEVVSAIGIAHMVWRMKRSSVSMRDTFERQALRITGSAFYLLSAGLLIGAGIAFWQGTTPITTIVGMFVSLVSIATMYFLFRYKLKVGKALGSDAIIADANCTKTCFYLSFILLASSLLYYMFELPYVDAIGSLGIAWYAFKEGKEAFENSNSDSLSCCNSSC